MSEQGHNWEVRRGFIGRELAVKAEAEASVLRTFPASYARSYSPLSRSWDPGRLSVLRVAFSEVPEDQLVNLRQVAQAVNDAAAELAGEVPGSRQDAGREPGDVFLNFYKPRATTGDHQDSYAAATVAVGVSGIADAYIWDADRQEWLEPVTLNVGDALCLKNNVLPEERPLHRVDCGTLLPRLAVVSADI